MIQIERRLDVELNSPDVLRAFMRLHSHSVRTLARRVGVSSSMIGHLLTGHRKNVRPEVARAIAKELDAPIQALFGAKVSTVSRETGRPAA